jgi:hypothetical protein
VIWPVVRELDGLILTGGGDLSSCLFGKPPHPLDRDARCLARRMGALYRAAGMAALHPHPGYLPGDATHERGAGRHALPGPASAVAEGAATTTPPSCERQGLLLELGQPPHPACATRQPAGNGGAREGYTRSAISGCGGIDSKNWSLQSWRLAHL